MIAEIEGGNPDLGGGAYVNQNVPPAESVRPQARPESAPVEPTLRPVARPEGLGADTGEPVAAAELTSGGASQATGSDGSQQTARANSTPPEVQALIQAMTSRPQTEEEKVALEEYLATIQGAG